MVRTLRSIVLVLVAAAASGCVQIYQGVPGPGAPPAAPSASREEEKDDPFEPWDEVLEDSEEIEGFFTLHRKRDGTLLLELPESRLGERFGLVMHYSRGVGDFNVQQGLPLSEARLMRFERVHERVHVVHENPRFRADEGSRYARALEGNLGHSVAAALEIESREEDLDRLLVHVTEWLVSDYAAVSDRLGGAFGGKPVTLDDERSHVGRVLGFPRNVEIDAELTYSASSPPQFSLGAGVSDWRSIPVGVRYSLFALPEEPMVPRVGDDRVGYFLDARWDFSRDQRESPYVAYVHRWRLEKRDPRAEVSEPVEPIVYYVDRSVPEAYRPYVKEGIEAWNRAFEAAGFRNAVVARDPPAGDTTWSAEDVRHSTVRWTPSYNMGYAIGPSQADPRTGEILNADILISTAFLRAWVQEWRELVAPGSGDGPALSAIGEGPSGSDPVDPSAAGGDLAPLVARFEAARRAALAQPAHLRDRMCLAELGKAHQAALGATLLAGLGELDVEEALPEPYVAAAIKDLVMHEVGHTLGLRHNFKGSSAIPHERLNDTDFTGEHGLTLSVMDYGPVNVSPDRGRQGHYWNPTVGTYDVWAIRYGYATMYEQEEDGPLATSGTPIRDPEAERVGLRKIASRAADPLHAYNTDEDTHLGAYAVDPLSNTWDLGSDPMAYALDRAALIDRIQPRLEERLVGQGESFDRLRSGLNALIFERYLSLMPVTKMVGGLYFSRDHRGDPEGRPPFRPVAAEGQREAVAFIVDQAFDGDAWSFDPELLNKAAPERLTHWGTGFITLPVDYPLHSQVLLIQRVLLRELMAPPRLWRLIDNEARAPAGTRPYTASELFDTMTDVVWSETPPDGAPRPVRSLRRNLQRIHLEHLGDLLLDRPPPGITSSVPEDGRSLARRELEEIVRRVDAALGRTGDPMTEAHLSESRVRARRLLDVSLEL